MKLIGYTRVSTQEQATEGHSMDAQRMRLEDYARLMGHELVCIIEDRGVSAKTADRPGLQQALAYLTAGKADGLLIVKLDRLTRSVRDMADMMARYFSSKHPYALISVNDSLDTKSSSGQLVVNILTAVAEWERTQISERTREGLRAAKAKGVDLGAKRRHKIDPELVARTYEETGSYRETAKLLGNISDKTVRGIVERCASN